MTKLSVAETIRFAYGFAFGQIGAIIGLVWLPLVLVAVLQFLPFAIGTAYPAGGADTATATGGAFLNLIFSTAALVLFAMNCVSVTQQALGLRSGSATFHFAIGWPEWRMFASISVCAFVLILAIGLYAIIGTAIQAAAGGAPTLGLLADLYTIAGLGALIWFGLRLFFLLPSVVVAEEHADFPGARMLRSRNFLRILAWLLALAVPPFVVTLFFVDSPRAWILSRRNFWRILAVFLAVTVPLLLVQIAALVAIVGPGLFAPLPADPVTAATEFEHRLGMLDHHMPSMIGLTLVLTPFNLGLTLGAAASAYRTLAAAKPPTRAGGTV